jgi:AcrR family transcriptional regulator
MTAPRRRPPSATKSAARLGKAELKKQLLGHAKQLFLTLGYPETTTAQVAQAAGVSEAVFQRHFDGKPALFQGVVEEIRAATVGRWQAETAPLTDPLAKLHAIVELYLGSTREHALEFRVLHRSLTECTDAEVQGPLRSFYLDCEALLAGVIAEGQQAGVFRRSLDPRVGAWELIRSALGYTLTLPLAVPLYEEPDYLPRAIDCMLHCLLKTDV